MNSNELKNTFEDLGIWQRGDQRAPHKPIMLLYALSRLQQGEEILSYNEIYKPVENILKIVMHSKSFSHSHYPFWYLKNDKIWKIHNIEELKFRKKKDEPLKSELKKFNTQAGFNQEVLDVFRKTPDLIAESARILLDAHFC